MPRQKGDAIIDVDQQGEGDTNDDTNQKSPRKRQIFSWPRQPPINVRIIQSHSLYSLLNSFADCLFGTSTGKFPFEYVTWRKISGKVCLT